MAYITDEESTTVSLASHYAETDEYKNLWLDDFDAMLDRSKKAGVLSMIITGGSLKESKSALDKAKKHSQSTIIIVLVYSAYPQAVQSVFVF